jgi:hypothetical protein
MSISRVQVNHWFLTLRAAPFPKSQKALGGKTMQLINDDLIEKFEQNSVAEDLVVARYYDVTSRWEWFAITFDGSDIFYGLVVGLETEFGSFSLSEFQFLNESAGYARIRLDLDFTPILVNELRSISY